MIDHLLAIAIRTNSKLTQDDINFAPETKYKKNKVFKQLIRFNDRDRKIAEWCLKFQFFLFCILTDVCGNIHVGEAVRFESILYISLSSKFLILVRLTE